MVRMSCIARVVESAQVASPVKRRMHSKAHSEFTLHIF
jgi:hypothetical protein